MRQPGVKTREDKQESKVQIIRQKGRKAGKAQNNKDSFDNHRQLVFFHIAKTSPMSFQDTEKDIHALIAYCNSLFNCITESSLNSPQLFNKQAFWDWD